MWAKKAISLLTTALAFFSPPSFASSVETVTAEARYEMAERDSLQEARKIAIQKAQGEAVRQAGSFVLTRTEVRKERIQKRTTRAIAAGILQTEVLDGGAEIDDGDLYYHVAIRATVDKASLKGDIQEILENEKRKAAAEKTYERVRYLREELLDPTVEKERGALLTEIEEKRNKLRRVVRGEGDLGDLARKRRIEQGSLKEQVEGRFWKKLGEQVFMEMGQVYSPSPGEIAVKVHVGVRPDGVFNWLQQHVNLQPMDTINNDRNGLLGLGKVQNPRSQGVREAITERQLIVYVGFKGRGKAFEKYIPLSGEFCGLNKAKYCWIASQEKVITFEGVSQSILNDQDGVEMGVVLAKDWSPGGLSKPKPARSPSLR